MVRTFLTCYVTGLKFYVRIREIFISQVYPYVIYYLILHEQDKSFRTLDEGQVYTESLWSLRRRYFTKTTRIDMKP